MIEDFILGKLKNTQLVKFEQMAKKSKELTSEIEFQQTLCDAILETDVIDLRDNLNSIINGKVKEDISTNALFDLAQNLNSNSIAKSDYNELQNIDNSLQLIHIKNHNKTNTERIHFIDHNTTNENHEMNLSVNDDSLWLEISDSIKENDIIDLRDNLLQITNSANIDINDIEIDQYLDNELSPQEVFEFESKVTHDSNLSSQLNLHKEINNALVEDDIDDLRSNLTSILDEEQMVSFSEIKRIDDYLLNYLDDTESSEFEKMLQENVRLQSEVKLNESINSSIQEKEIIDIRSSLSSIIAEEKEETNIRQFIPMHLNKKPARIIGAAASIAAIVSFGAINYNNQNTTIDEIYSNAFKPYDAAGLYRSGINSSPEIRGIDMYNNKEYSGAINQFNLVLAKNPEHPTCNFYSGLSHQELQKYNNAILSFQKVIDERDNLFIEQAEWYKALCLLHTSEQTKAIKSFNSIYNKGGYYSKDAKEILKKLK